MTTATVQSHQISCSHDEDLHDLVDASASLGPVEYSETVMCAKCIGECKIF